MGCKNSKDNEITQQIKEQHIKDTFKRKIVRDGENQEDEVQVELKLGFLYAGSDSFCVELPDGAIRLLVCDPLLKELIICFEKGVKWNLICDNLNTFLKWKYALSVSMRPIMARNEKNCQICDRGFAVRSSFNCHICGRKLCNICSRFVSQLGFLMYLREVRICESCTRVVQRIKSEESESIVDRSISKSFARSKSGCENPSIRYSLRNEKSQSLLKTGCPSGLNTLS
ncbi:hypothetical protein SteCoe_8855 [Stentor coeruleus]|uniref:FYVE-type domain-containing protein n=1 Tax=Stentor coeruleus TaxID=5963 RepID=A0A1R2CJA4_9CILI|nr:hypothetical protein SteCoe_8855 [Stentor coeruleus]